MTLSAITKNREWNTKFVSTEQGEIAQEVLQEFEELWSDRHTLEYSEFIENYRLEYLRSKMVRDQRKAAIQEEIVELDRVRLEPNKMQVAFVNNVLALRDQNVKKAMLCSATGARRIIMTGRKSLIYKGFGPVFSFGRSPGQGKRGEILNNQSDYIGKNKNICRHGLAKRTAEVILYK